MLNLLFGAVGAAYILYGKKQSHFTVLFAGLALIVVPYFIGNGYLLCAVCVVIMVAPKILK